MAYHWILFSFCYAHEPEHLERAYIGIAPAAQSYLCIYIYLYIYTVQIKTFRPTMLYCSDKSLLLLFFI